MGGFLEDYGLVVLFAIVALQACGIPGPPGKTSLVIAALLAAEGHFTIEDVVAVAAVGGALGGYAGYALGRSGARRLLERPFVARRVARPLAAAEELFEQHGGKAVFMARFLPGLKVVAAPAAGISRMRWAGFALWHTLAAIAFAAGFGLTAYWAGEGVLELVESFGLFALLALVPAAALVWIAYRQFRSRRPRASTA